MVMKHMMRCFLAVVKFSRRVGRKILETCEVQGETGVLNVTKVMKSSLKHSTKCDRQKMRFFYNLIYVVDSPIASCNNVKLHKRTLCTRASHCNAATGENSLVGYY